MANTEIVLLLLMSLVSSSIQGNYMMPNQAANYNPKTDGVVELTQKNFKTLVLNSDAHWLVIFEFPGPQCTYCIQISEIVKKAVPLLKEKRINVGFVDSMTSDGQKLVDSYGIKMFPTVYIFGREKESPIKYPFSPRSPQDLVNDVVFFLNKPPPAAGQCGKDTQQNPKSATYELTDENFEEVVLKCDDPWIVNFYVPEEDLCVQFIPFFEAAAKEFNGRVKFGSLYQYGSKIAEKYEPTMKVCSVKLFPAGNKNRKPVDYNNGTHSITISTNLVPWIKSAIGASLPTPGINELTSQSVLDSKCKNSGVSSCIFLFLGNSNKCDGNCQRTYLDLLKQLTNEMKAENWAWFWTTEGRQPSFEQVFGVQYFPGVVAVELQTKTFSTTRSTTSLTKVKEFIQGHANSRLPSKNLPASGLPAVRA